MSSRPVHGDAAVAVEGPLALRSPFLIAAFRLYLRWYFWRKFHAVRLSRTNVPLLHEGRPLVIYCNHPSWWDPAVLLLALPRLFPGRRGFGPMDEEQLGRYRMFRRMGMFGIDGGRSGAVRFLRTALAGLAERHTLLCITAEGSFTDGRVRPVILRPGLAHLARRMPGAVFLPLALEYCFWNESRPEALLRFGQPVDSSLAPERSIGDWQCALENALELAMDGLAQESITRNPMLFTRLFNGRAGVGGVYDLSRRVRAAAGGRAFDPHHEQHGRW